jgi:light-regulated signal transduction histidine kinase (bacteriophytochrome)
MEEIEQDISEDDKRYLKIIRDNALKMNQLITDLLSFSRLGRKALKEQQINTIQLVKKIYQQEKVNLTNREHQFVLKPLPEIVADKRMLEIVFTNLLSNAFKYTIDREVAYVEVGFTQQENKQVFYVKDNGVGFDMKYIDKVFGAFQRLHNDEKYGGSGIGLSIVQRIVNKHGGKIWAESEPGKGTTFYFYLNL